MTTADAMMDAVHHKNTLAQSFGAGFASARGWAGSFARKTRMDKVAGMLGRFFGKIWGATAKVRMFAQANALPLAAVALLTPTGQGMVIGAFNLLRRGLNRVDMGIVWLMAKFGAPGKKLAMRYAVLAARMDNAYERHVTGSVRKVFSFVNSGGYLGMALRYAIVTAAIGAMATAASGVIAVLLFIWAGCYAIGTVFALVAATNPGIATQHQLAVAEREAATAKYRAERSARKAAEKDLRDVAKVAAMAAKAEAKAAAEAVKAAAVAAETAKVVNIKSEKSEK